MDVKYTKETHTYKYTNTVHTAAKVTGKMYSVNTFSQHLHGTFKGSHTFEQ